MKNKNIQINTTKKVALSVFVLLILIASAITTQTTEAFLTSSEGGTIAFSIPCVSSMGPGFWALKTNSPTPIVYLYPSWTMRNNYLPPGPGISTLGLVTAFIDCTTPTIPPITLVGRMSILYGTALGL